MTASERLERFVDAARQTRGLTLCNGVRLTHCRSTWTIEDAIGERAPFFHPSMLAETDEAIPERATVESAVWE